jgi:hypothetical protein
MHHRPPWWCCVATLLVAVSSFAQTPTPTPRTLLVLHNGNTACANLTIGGETRCVYNYPVPPNVATVHAPLDCALGGGKVWGVPENQLDMWSVDSTGGTGAFVQRYPVPAPSPSIFSNSGGTQIDISAATEGITYAFGKVFFPQGGAYLYGGTNRNASRIMEYTAATASTAEKWRSYPLPINNYCVTGVLVHPESRRLYTTGSGGPSSGRAIASIDPLAWNDTQADPLYNFAGFPGDLPIPASAWTFVTTLGADVPAGLWRDRTDRILVANYWGNGFQILTSPATSLQHVPFASLYGPFLRAVAHLGRGPWKILEDPVTGAIWISATFADQIIKVDPTCCGMTYYDVPLQADEFVHSEALDSAGNLWFGVYTNLSPAPMGHGKIGRITPGGAVQITSMSDAGMIGGCAGICVNQASNDDVWCMGFNGGTMALLRKP